MFGISKVTVFVKLVLIVLVLLRFVLAQERMKQAGAELGQAQIKLELGFTFIKI